MRGFSKTSLVSVMLAALSGVLPGVDCSSQNIFPTWAAVYFAAQNGAVWALRMSIFCHTLPAI